MATVKITVFLLLQTALCAHSTHLLAAGPRSQLSPAVRRQRSPRCMARAVALPFPPQAAQWIGASIAAGMLGTPFVIPALKTWYPQVRKPTWCPPGGAFAPVWSVLYGLLGYSASLVAASVGAKSLRQYALATFAVHFAINLAWAPMFFGARRITLAAWWNVVNLAAAALNLHAFWQVSPLAGALMAPYMLWCAFATALNFSISSLNRGGAAGDGSRSE